MTEDQVFTALDPATRKQVEALDQKIATAEAHVAKVTRQLEAEQRARGR